jgi:arginyl-tRNA synthetase
MMNFESFLKEHITSFPHFTDHMAPPRVNFSFGPETDYQINIDQLTKAGFEDEFLKHLNGNDILCSKIEITQTTNNKGNKFVNFSITNNCLVSLLEHFNHHHVVCLSDECEPKTIVIDYSSPNLSKDMHVGHLRSTIIGDCLANILQYVGHNVIRRNHIGDFGLPFGIIVEYVFTVGIDIIESTPLQTIYVNAKKMFDTNPEFADKAYTRTQLLQTKSDDMTNEIWHRIYTKSLASYDEIYKLLCISESLTVKGESWYEPLIDHVKTILSDHSLVEINDGRTIIKVDGYQPMTYIKSESKGKAYTYDTTDIVALYHRITDEKADQVYYVVDHGQSLHFEQLFALGKTIGWLNSTKTGKHISFGTIQGKDHKRIKSRDGDTPKLLDLVTEAIETTKEMYLTKHSDINMDTITKIAIGSLKYFELSIKRDTTYVFEFKKMLKFSGNTYTYASYALVRCNSVFAKVVDSGFDINAIVLNDSELKYVDYVLLRKIMYFPGVIGRLIADSYPHYLCSQLYNLVDAFHTNYEATRCIDFSSDNKVTHIYQSRIALYMLVKEVITICFNLLGLPIVDRI